jgi:hypothetical protein
MAFFAQHGAGFAAAGAVQKATFSALFVLLKISSPSAHPKHPKFHDAAPASSALAP